MGDIINKYWDILNLYEDYVEKGTKSDSKKLVLEKKTDIEASLIKITNDIKSCKKCNLHETRINTVPGMGVTNPLLMIIGESPEEDEDKTGNPFVGKAGQFLDKWLEAIKLSRKTNCFTTNMIKCRTPEDRAPLPIEITLCISFLKKQIEILKPKVILTLGEISTQVILESDSGIEDLRGKVFEYRGIPLLSTYHPNSVLKNNELKRPVWADLKKLRELIDNE